MHRAPANHLDQGVAVAAHFEHLGGDVHPHFLHHTEDVPLGGRGRGPDDEVRPAQSIEMGRVVGRVEDAVEQLSQLLGGRRRLDVEERVEGLGCRHVMSLGAHSADPRRKVRHILRGPPHAKPLEAAELRDLQVGVGDVPLLVEEDVDLPVPFETGDRIDRNPSHGGCSAHSSSSLVKKWELKDGS